MKPRDRQALRLGEDHKMSVYVKGATQLEVCSFAEANRALMYGQRNRKVCDQPRTVCLIVHFFCRICHTNKCHPFYVAAMTLNID